MDAIGGIDLLVNNAGVNIPLPLQDITEKNFDYLVSVDLRAYVMLMHCAAKYMIDHDLQGCIVNISSSRGERAYANAGIHCGIKACLNHMAESFALDLAPYRIRVNNVATALLAYAGMVGYTFVLMRKQPPLALYESRRRQPGFLPLDQPPAADPADHSAGGFQLLYPSRI